MLFVHRMCRGVRWVFSAGISRSTFKCYVSVWPGLTACCISRNFTSSNMQHLMVSLCYHFCFNLSRLIMVRSHIHVISPPSHVRFAGVLL